VTKTTRTSSYLRQVTRHHEGNLPLLKPPHTLAQHWRTLSPYERTTETMQPARYSLAETGTSQVLQKPASLSIQDETEPQPTQPPTKIEQAAGKQEATSPSSTRPSAFLAPVTLPDSSPVTEERTTATSAQVRRSPASVEPTPEPLARKQRSQVEVRQVPATSTHSSTAETDQSSLATLERNAPDELRRAEIAAGTGRSSLVTRAAPDKPTGVSDNVKPASITLRPRSGQPQEAIGTPTNNRRITDLAEQESRISARALEPQRRSAALPYKQETQQHAAIHIGSIDIHIVAAAPLAPARSATARPHSSLSREMTSFIGLRQG